MRISHTIRQIIRGHRNLPYVGSFPGRTVYAIMIPVISVLSMAIAAEEPFSTKHGPLSVLVPVYLSVLVCAVLIPMICLARSALIRAERSDLAVRRTNAARLARGRVFPDPDTASPSATSWPRAAMPAAGCAAKYTAEHMAKHAARHENCSPITAPNPRRILATGSGTS